MESPPSFSGWSEAPISISEDSGLPLTSGSVSSGSVSGSVSGERVICELPDSDGEDKSLSQYDSLDYSDSGGMCGEHFNTLKKGPNVVNLPIEPPPEFQDNPPSPAARQYELSSKLKSDIPKNWSQNRSKINRDICSGRLVTVSFSPVHSLSRSHTSGNTAPVLLTGLTGSCSQNNTGNNINQRLYSSHNSLSAVQNGNADDSHFITQAMSHDALNGEISDIYNVPFDSDIYAVPVDTVKPLYEQHNNRNNGNNKTTTTVNKPRRQIRQHRKRRRNTSAGEQCGLDRSSDLGLERMTSVDTDTNNQKRGGGKRHSVAGSSGTTSATHISQEPLHMTLEEVRNYLHALYSSSSDSSENNRNKIETQKTLQHIENNNQIDSIQINYKTSNGTKKSRKKTKKIITDITDITSKDSKNTSKKETVVKPKKSTFSLTIRQTLCNIFRFRKIHSPDRGFFKKQKVNGDLKSEDKGNQELNNKKTDLCKRALPPLPSGKLRVESEIHDSEDTSMDFTLSIEKVKDYGWYWGPISGEAAERILSNEPDGSFIVRDSSDHHYIFSLTFKLNGCVRHVRIEHDQGNFSFGSCTRFKSHTIVQFIQNAVEHSRSGRYLFFLHRRPVLGPMRVQLLHPVSRFKQVQSLQHMCRFIILKVVRRDLIPSLPLPRRVIDYLSTKQYYSELLTDGESDHGQLNDNSDHHGHNQVNNSEYGQQNHGQVNHGHGELNHGQQNHGVNYGDNYNGHGHLNDTTVNNRSTVNDRSMVNDRTMINDRSTVNLPPQSAVVHVITTETEEIDRLNQYRFHVIEQNTDSDLESSTQVLSSSVADTDDGKDVGSSDSSNVNEIEGIRRGGRFRIGLRNNRERRFSTRHQCDESSS